MFTELEKNCLEDSYFKILSKNADYYEVQSKNTKHCWLIQKTDKDACIHTMHKYYKSIKHYHFQCNSANLKSAVKKIKKHDSYILRYKN